MVDGIMVNEKCKSLARKIKEIVDAKSSFADWLNNTNVRAQLKQDIKICLVKNGYPPQYTPEVFREVMEQVENFKEHESPDDNILSVGNSSTIIKDSEIAKEVNAIPRYSEYHKGCVPLFENLRVACGCFEANEKPESNEWVDVSGYGLKTDRDIYFAVYAKGESMSPKIHDGDICVFEWYHGGSRDGEIVLAQCSDFDRDYDGKYTIKKYHSEKAVTEESWQHTKITLIPLNKSSIYKSFEFGKNETDTIYGVLKCVLNNDLHRK